MIEINTILLNYGVLGLWTASLLYDRVTFQKQLKEIIRRNTEALLLVHECLKIR